MRRRRRLRLQAKEKKAKGGKKAAERDLDDLKREIEIVRVADALEKKLIIIVARTL